MGRLPNLPPSSLATEGQRAREEVPERCLPPSGGGFRPRRPWTAERCVRRAPGRERPATAANERPVRA